MLGEMQKAGKNVPKEARQTVGSQLNAMRDQMRAQIRSVLHGRLPQRHRPGTVRVPETAGCRYRPLGHGAAGERGAPGAWPAAAAKLGAEAAQAGDARRSGAAAKAPAEPAPEPLAKGRGAVTAANAGGAPAAPVEAPGYRRAANIRDAYTRYNDVISATVMRDRAAVKELLDDGKYPNSRQKDGITPLMIAASNGDADIAAMLLAKGADPALRAPGGRSALSIAKGRGAAGAEMVQLLERSGAKD